MRALLFDTPGLAQDVLKITDLPTPLPGPGEVRLRVQARPINPSDVMFVRGLYGIRPQVPGSGAGFEGAGVIEAVGEGVDLPVGTVAAFTTVGTWQEQAVVPAHSLLPVPANMPIEAACQLFVNPFTAWAMLHESNIPAGGWLLQSAGASAFGKLVIQLCKRMGIQTISTVRRPELVTELKALGATEVVDTSSEDLYKAVKRITGGKMASAALDAVGGSLGAELLNCLHNGGTLYVYGVLSLENISLNGGLLIFKNLTVKGFWLSEWMARAQKDVRKQARTELIALLTSGELKAPVEATYDLADYRKALDHEARPGRFGKVVLVG